MLGRPHQGPQAREALQAKPGKSTRERGHKPSKRRKARENKMAQRMKSTIKYGNVMGYSAQGHQG